jgi:hypothetical protein
LLAVGGSSDVAIVKNLSVGAFGHGGFRSAI